MPTAAPSACTASGCHGVKPCPKHPPRKPWAHKVASRHARGYGAEWERIRLQVLERDHFSCQVTDPMGKRCGVRTGRVDHKKPKAEGGTDALSNLRAICLYHDREKSAREGNAAKARRAKSSAIYDRGPRGRPSAREREIDASRNENRGGA